MAINIANLQNVVTTPVRDALRALWIGIGTILVAIVVMWIFNILGLRGVNVPIALIGSLLIAMVGFRATNVVGFGFLGAIIWALQDKDKSQGAAAGLIWLTEIVIALGMTFVLAAFTLMTLSLQQSPGAFWVLFFGITLMILVQQHWKWKTSWAPWIISTYAVVCILVAGWTTFGGAYTGNSFNRTTGEPRFMVDPVTRNIIDGIEPADCRPILEQGGKLLKPEHQTKDGKVFEYAEKGTCYSPETGRRAVPMSADEAMKRNPTAWMTTVKQEVGAMPLPLVMQTWTFWMALGGILLIALWLSSRKSPNSDGVKSGDTVKKTVTSRPEFSFTDKLWGTILLLIGAFIVFILVGSVGSIVLSATDTDDWLERIISGQTKQFNCTTKKELMANPITKAGRSIVVCPEEGELVLFVPYPYSQELIVDFSEKFVRENKQSLAWRRLMDFVQIKRPFTYPGSVAGSWKIVPANPTSDPYRKYESPWDSSGLTAIELYVRTVE